MLEHLKKEKALQTLYLTPGGSVKYIKTLADHEDEMGAAGVLNDVRQLMGHEHDDRHKMPGDLAYELDSYKDLSKVEREAARYGVEISSQLRGTFG